MKVTLPAGPDLATEPRPTPAAPPPVLGRWVLVVFGLAMLATTLWRVEQLTTFLPADAGHYLADADALAGNGVRESRHLPVFPALLAAIRLVLPDLLAVKIALVAVLATMYGGFYVFVRGRVGGPAGELAGLVVFALAPLYAEGVGWYGASMLLGFGLAMIAMRCLDAALEAPGTRPVAGAGVACALVGLTHPLPFLFLTQVTAVMVLARLVEARRRAGPHAVGRLLRAVAGVAGVTALLVLPVVPFYLGLRAPLEFGVDLDRVVRLGRWAFRGDVLIWLLLPAAAVAFGMARRRVTGSATGDGGRRRLAEWSATVAVAALGGLVLAEGHDSYTSRSLYALPIAAAVAAALLAGPVVAVMARRPGAASFAAPSAWRRGVATVLLLLVAFRLGTSYVRRLDIAVRYYANPSVGEMEAFRWLRGRGGVVAVTPKGADKTAGTLHAWMIEGLSRIRAIGTGESYLALFDEAERDSVDVDRLVSGSLMVEKGNVRISAGEGLASPISIAGRYEGDWFSLVDVAVGPVGTPPSLRPAVEGAAPDAAGGQPTLVIDGGDVTVRAAAEGGAVTLTIHRRGADAPIIVDVAPPPTASVVELRAAGTGAAIERPVGNGTARIGIVPGGAAVATVEADSRTGVPRVRVTGPPAGELAVRLVLDGLDPPDRDGSARREVFSDVELFQRHDIRWLFTWRQTGSVAALAQRHCLRPAMQNEAVVIFEVIPECRRPAT